MAEPIRYVLTDAEFDVVWDRLMLGATPAALRLPSPGRTRAERLRIAADGLHGLRARGLAGPSGPDPGLVRLLGLLARPHHQLEVRGWFGHPLRAVGADRDGEGALAVHADRTVTVSSAGSPAHAAVSALPHRRPGPGPALVVPTVLLERVLAPGRTGGALRAGDPAGAGPAAAPAAGDPLVGPEARLRGMLHGPAHRAQVCAVRYDRWGNPHRPSGQVTVVDSAAGRYRLTRDACRDTGWATLAPVDDRRLRPLLAGLLELSPGPSAA
ncbi:ESX secretion-associated protein EspG [Pseudonocardia nantongensis]|uniref:ESX secretion-associated protein EspG n=1 Tax=Pseudonocardia nantongensis TaxID=1181885 RepID=UPI00397C9171